jgi:soluble lytic murein transglycosylase-like protein
VSRRTLLIVLLILGVLAVTAEKTGVVDSAIDLLAGWKQRGAKYLPLLYAAEDRYGIPRDLLARQAYQESHFRDDIVSGATVSSAGALGIMQIVPKFHPTAQPLNVPAAIDYAASFLSKLHAQFGSWGLALAAYNAGPGNVQKYGGIPPFDETQKYVLDILLDVNTGRSGARVV